MVKPMDQTPHPGGPRNEQWQHRSCMVKRGGFPSGKAAKGPRQYAPEIQQCGWGKQPKSNKFGTRGDCLGLPCTWLWFYSQKSWMHDLQEQKVQNTETNAKPRCGPSKSKPKSRGAKHCKQKSKHRGQGSATHLGAVDRASCLEMRTPKCEHRLGKEGSAWT